MAKEKENKKMNKKQQAQYEKKRADTARKQHRDDEDRVHLFSHGKNFDLGLLITVFILLTVGFIMVLSASGPYSLRTEGDSYFYFKKQIEFALVGVVIMFIVSKFDYRLLNSRLSWLVYFGGLRTDVISFSSWHWCSKK